MTSLGPAGVDAVHALVGDLAGTRPPLYAALAARLRLLIGDGRLPIGARLPAERELAAALHVSRATVAAAYGRLREQGWADARQGAGTWTRLPAGPSQGAWLPAPARPGVIDFAHAAPAAPPQVPAAFAAALDELPRLLPGHGYHPQGLPELRARIADRYTARGVPTTPEQVLVTAGALHAVSVAVETLVDRGGRVLVEHPTYPNALDAVRSLGRRAVPVAATAGEPDALVRDLSRAARQTSPGAAYLMPDFQNPTGLLLDEPLRRRLAVGLRQAGVMAIVDETLADLGIDAEPPPPFAAIARPEAVVTVGSMSKSVWGGLRVGWLRAEEDVVRRLAAVAGHTHMSGPVLEQLAACQLLDAADEVLTARRDDLRRQRDVLVAELGRHLPGWEVPVPSGGLVLWCRLPSLSSTALVSAAESRGLLLAPGPRFGTGHAFDDRLRLPYTQPVDVITRGVQLLADAVADLPTARHVAVAEQIVV
ncbi:MAG TPA: PLP-dependent aminotransferase family protein [Actinomycetes bacterium]